LNTSDCDPLNLSNLDKNNYQSKSDLASNNPDTLRVTINLLSQDLSKANEQLQHLSSLPDLESKNQDLVQKLESAQGKISKLETLLKECQNELMTSKNKIKKYDEKLMGTRIALEKTKIKYEKKYTQEVKTNRGKSNSLKFSHKRNC